jgi:hypothetical protein
MFHLNYLNYLFDNKQYKKYNIDNLSNKNLNGGLDEDNQNVNDINNNVSKSPKISTTLFTDSSRITLYRIKKGTILYHGSKSKETFNPFNIKLDDDILAGYFTTNKQFSADYISRCAFYPKEQGYIHKFIVKRNIDRVLIVSKFDKKSDWDVKKIENLFCNSNNKYGEKLDGVGFFYLSNNYNEFNNESIDNDNQETSSNYELELALCDPNNFLDYVSTQRCIAVRKISSNYQFTQE